MSGCDPWDGILCCFGFLSLSGCRHQIVKRLTYFPPQPPLYVLDESKKKNNNAYELEMRNISDREHTRTMWVIDEGGNQVYPMVISSYFKFDFVKTRRGETIATMFIKCSESEVQTTVLYSHGNAADMGCLRDYLREFSAHLQVNVLAYDYSGYGLSSGQPTAANTYADVEAAYKHLTTEYPEQSKRVIGYGQSLGSSLTIYLGATEPLVGLVIHSGLMSGIRTLNPELKKSWWFDLYPNVDTVKQVQAPLMVVHGTNDEDMPLIHGQMIAKNAANPYTPYYCKGGGHNDIEVRFRDELFAKLGEFFNHLKSTDLVV